MTEALGEMLHQQTCIPSEIPAKAISDPEEVSLPSIDMFINPDKKKDKEKIVKEKEEMAKHYFNTSDMRSLYPNLFRILWESTLPCFSLLRSCELGGSKINCEEIFSRVPTDMGMCCAVNAEDTLRESTYKTLVKEMQGNVTKKEVKSKVGKKNGLSLTLDLHSNTVSFGTQDQRYDAFSLFIGEPTEFPMMRERGLQLEPGSEHFVDLSATLVSVNGIRDISPEARDCFFVDEGRLDFYKSYTHSNCRLECAMKKAEEEYGCIPWHLPQVRSVKYNYHFRGKTRPHATPGPRGSSTRIWRSRQLAATIAGPTATLPAIPVYSPHQNSGYEMYGTEK